MEVKKSYSKMMPEIEIKYKRGEFEKVKISSSQEGADLLRKLFNEDRIEYTEEVIILYLNQGNKTIGWQKHSSGGMVCSVIDIRTILVTALGCGAMNIMVSHNHPSGQLYPSNEDKGFTKRLTEGCSAIGIKLLDHIILSGCDNGYYSFSDEGLL